MAESPVAAPCSGVPLTHGSHAAGVRSQLQLCWTWPVAAVEERLGRGSGSLQMCTELWRNLCLHGEERCGAHHPPSQMEVACEAEQ